MIAPQVLIALVLSSVGATEVVTEPIVNGYVAPVLSDSTGAFDVLEINRSGGTLLRRDDYLRFSIGESLDRAQRFIEPGRDVSGDRVADIVVRGWSGGAHCCFTAWVYSLGDTLKLLA
jgi:hypothetical protein